MLTAKEIAEEINCKTEKVIQYLCRDDFSHVNRYRIGNKYFYENITDSDKKKLKTYIESAKKRSGHKCIC